MDEFWEPSGDECARYLAGTDTGVFAVVWDPCIIDKVKIRNTYASR